MIKAEKRDSISTKIRESRANTKKLYQIVNNLVGKEDVNAMPEGKTNKELANEFADFFLQKILKIIMVFPHNIIHYIRFKILL